MATDVLCSIRREVAIQTVEGEVRLTVVGSTEVRLSGKRLRGCSNGRQEARETGGWRGGRQREVDEWGRGEGRVGKGGEREEGGIEKRKRRMREGGEREDEGSSSQEGKKEGGVEEI